MARLNTSAEILHRLTEVGVTDDKTGTFGSTTTTGAVAVGATVVPFTAVTNFAVNDKVRLGRTEYNEIASIATLNVTMKRPLEFAHAIGEAVVEVVDVPIGEVSTDGVMFDSQTEETSLKVGTARGVYLYIPGSTEQKFTFNMVNCSLENFAESFGQNPTGITGTGTTIDPYILTLNPNNFGTQPERSWYFIGVREDGMFIRGEFWRSKIYAPQTQIKLTTGEPALIPMNLRTVGLIRFFLNT